MLPSVRHAGCDSGCDSGCHKGVTAATKPTSPAALGSQCSREHWSTALRMWCLPGDVPASTQGTCASPNYKLPGTEKGMHGPQ